ncbi:MAG: AAA family ATPase [Planctomycetota bacterium]
MQANPGLSPPLVPMPWHQTARVALATHRILVLIGDPGCGKTEFVQQQCRTATGEPAEELQGGPKVDDLSFFGRYTLAGDTTPFVDGPLWRALRRGSWFVLNDAGQVPFAQLSALLPLRHGQELTNPISQERLQVPASFRLVLTGNRDNNSCKSNLSAMQSLLDGSLLVDVPEPIDDVVRAVLRAHQPTLNDERLGRLLSIKKRFQDLNGEDEKRKIQIGIRALLQLGTLLAAGMDENEAIATAVVGKFLLDKDRYDAARLAVQFG